MTEPGDRSALSLRIPFHLSRWRVDRSVDRRQLTLKPSLHELSMANLRSWSWRRRWPWSLEPSQQKETCVCCSGFQSWLIKSGCDRPGTWLLRKARLTSRVIAWMKTEQTSPVSLMTHALVSKLVLTSVSCVLIETVASVASSAYVALVEVKGPVPSSHFNNVPVLHSNQPEIVTGLESILIQLQEKRLLLKPVDHCETQRSPLMVNLQHMHHKYPSDASKLGPSRPWHPTWP